MVNGLNWLKTDNRQNMSILWLMSFSKILFHHKQWSIYFDNPLSRKSRFIKLLMILDLDLVNGKSHFRNVLLNLTDRCWYYRSHGDVSWWRVDSGLSSNCVVCKVTGRSAAPEMCHPLLECTLHSSENMKIWGWDNRTLHTSISSNCYVLLWVGCVSHP